MTDEEFDLESEIMTDRKVTPEGRQICSPELPMPKDACRYAQMALGSLAKTADHITTEAEQRALAGSEALDLLEIVATSGVTDIDPEHKRIDYVEVQVDRDDWERIQAWRSAKEAADGKA